MPLISFWTNGENRSRFNEEINEAIDEHSWREKKQLMRELKKQLMNINGEKKKQLMNINGEKAGGHG